MPEQAHSILMPALIQLVRRNWPAPYLWIIQAGVRIVRGTHEEKQINGTNVRARDPLARPRRRRPSQRQTPFCICISTSRCAGAIAHTRSQKSPDLNIKDADRTVSLQDPSFLPSFSSSSYLERFKKELFKFIY